MTGTDLQTLAMPNGVTRQTVFDPLRNLPTAVTHTNAAGTVLARRTYDYDAAGRLTNRTQHRFGDETNRLDAFGYNVRSELTSAALGENDYAYTFDPIGNRIVTTENTEITEHLANNLNQYTNILCASASLRLNYDLDGNQTLVRTATGIWHVTYNAENRPVVFSNDTAVIEMAYDHQGRRFEYKETVNNTLARHERYLYLGKMSMPWSLNCCGGDPYDESMSCCINGMIVSRDEQNSVKLCRRKANIPGGGFFALLGLYHEFVVGPDGPPVGLGPRGTNGNPGCNLPLTPTELTDHTGESQDDCRIFKVSRCQFFERTEPGSPKGLWIPLLNDCNSTACDILWSGPSNRNPCPGPGLYF